MTENNQVAPPVKEQTENQSTSPFPREEIEKAFNNPLLKSFKKYLDPLMGYFESVEKRLQASDENFKAIGKAFDKLEPLIQLSNQVQQRQIQPQTQQPAQAQLPAANEGMMGLLMQVLPSILNQNTASNPLGDLAMESLKADIDLSKTLKSAVVSSIASRTTKTITESIPLG